ncbi:MAG: hypothetical protein KDA24_15415 [Deltaproteobacteria bacterium]|nr:hypothetical protein [Deltaproteobacteria bacterium]
MSWLFDRRLLLIALAFVVSLSCGRPSTRGGESCFDNGDCNDDGVNPDGEVDLEACVDGECDDVDCLTSGDCVVGQYCDLDGDDYACREGCESDSDCFAGQSCSDDGECETYGCRSTVLDCDFNEICNEDSGNCEQAPGLQCNSCDPAANYRDDNGTPSACDDTIGGNNGCGGDGSVCAGDALDAICWVGCTNVGEPGECPSGFTCAPASWTPGFGCADIPLGPYCIPVDGCEPNSP